MTRFVFGMGIALINHWRYIKKNFDPEYVVDNDSSKWGQVESHTNLLCISPEQLQNFELPEGLITVGDSYIAQQIQEQLRKVGIKAKLLTHELECWTKGEPLPEHLEAMSKNQKKILLFNTPEHDNIGDHLITLSEMDFLQRRFDDFKIYEITDIEYTWFHATIKSKVGQDDIILITGGGFLGSLWLYNGENNVRNILQEYPDNRVIILPQTIYFEENGRGNIELKKTINIYNQHKYLTICAREHKSYLFMKAILNSEIKIVHLPDIALFYKMKNNYQKERKKYVLICFRKDKERIVPEQTKQIVYNTLKNNEWTIKETSMHSENFEGISGRRNQVEKKLEEIKVAELVITDTLHCMISAAITQTPCIAFDNLSGKVQSVYEWIKELPYIQVCKDVSEFEELLKTAKVDESQKINFEIYENQLENIIRGNVKWE